MKNYTPNSALKQRGMTLIELTVVLLILIGLAGLLLPYVGGFLQRTQNASAADSLAELNKAIDRHETQFMGYPDDFDSLIDVNGNLITWLPGGTTTTSQLLALNIDTATPDNVVKSLIAADIDDLRPMLLGTENGFNATFNNTSGEETINSAKGTPGIAKIAVINPTFVKQIIENGMGLEVEDEDTVDDTNLENYYVVFGIGQKTQMAGRTIKEAPVYFSAGGDNPAKAYNRFLAVFKVNKEEGKPAEFIGTLSPDLKQQSHFMSSHYASVDDDD